MEQRTSILMGTGEVAWKNRLGRIAEEKPLSKTAKCSYIR